jgi:hypothetical protein
VARAKDVWLQLMMMRCDGMANHQQLTGGGTILNTLTTGTYEIQLFALSAVFFFFFFHRMDDFNPNEFLLLPFSPLLFSFKNSFPF